MGFEAWIAVAIVGAVFFLLLLTRLSPDLILAGGMTACLVLELAPARDLLSGFSNQGMLTVAALFVVASGIRETGAVWFVFHRLLGRTRSVFGAQARIIGPVAALSAFLNNTPLVAMMLPMVQDWARKRAIPSSKLLIPLSYAAILGGMATLLGTSTNLIVNGLVIEETGEGMGLFEITRVGVPCAIAGIAVVLVFGRRLLPSRGTLAGPQSDPREYVLEMLVEGKSPLVGQTIEGAGLRHLPGLYLAEIDREGRVLPAVSPEERLQADDRLVFVGVVESVLDLQNIRGLIPATNQRFKLEGEGQRCLVEAVVSHTNPGVHKSVREGRFRNTYNAAIIAVSRHGERLRLKIGDIVLQPGDTLLLESTPSFVEQHRNSRDFYLVSQVEGFTPPKHERAPLALGLLAAMVIAAATGILSMLQASFLAAGGMIATRCITGAGAFRTVDWRVLLAIASALGIGQALTVTGAAAAVANGAIGLAGGNPWVLLAAVYILTAAFTETITNNAAAVLVFPLAWAAATGAGLDPMPFVMAVMIAGSASFLTPIGYQTNLMVYGPGGYRAVDFIRMGLPVSLAVAVAAIGLIPLFWGFYG